jgi:hypothetical protein
VRRLVVTLSRWLRTATPRILELMEKSHFSQKTREMGHPTPSERWADRLDGGCWWRVKLGPSPGLWPRLIT